MRKLKRTLESALREGRNVMFRQAYYHVRLNILFVAENKTIEVFMNCACTDVGKVFGRESVMLKAVSPILMESTADGIMKVMR